MNREHLNQSILMIFHPQCGRSLVLLDPLEFLNIALLTLEILSQLPFGKALSPLLKYTLLVDQGFGLESLCMEVFVQENERARTNTSRGTPNQTLSNFN